MTTLAILEQRVGGLSHPSKMPGPSYGLDPADCITGSKLRKVPGSVCAHCYGCKGMYRCNPDVKKAWRRRKRAMQSKAWEAKIAEIIQRKQLTHWRWHDVGDLQGMTHLSRLVRIAKVCPMTNFWIPTKERSIVKAWIKRYGRLPANVVVRLSSPMIGQRPQPMAGCLTSTVDHAGTFDCPVKNGQEGCNTYGCRACWDPTVANVNYHRN